MSFFKDEARRIGDNRYYILDGKTPVNIPFEEWIRIFDFEDEGRQVNKTTIGDVRISTVFLGLDHRIHEDKPMLFETMIFGGEYDEYQERYSTWEEAEEGHQRACELVYGIDRG
jgi:hypothetical protein